MSATLVPDGAGFAETVRSNRVRLGVTQEELAERSGLSVRCVRRIESGAGGAPRPTTVRLLADAFGLTGEERTAFSRLAAGALGRPVPSIPAQLPADVPAFTGRHAQLAELDSLLPERSPRPTAMVTVAIVGAAGVGKTALAVHWGHRVRTCFPDGQLYVDLRGRLRHQVAPVEALTGFLRALGTPREDIPLDVDRAAALYRSVLADRRLLVVLDDAATVEQVRPLLPGAPGCLVLVTSRARLDTLVSGHGAHWLPLGVLSAEEARAFLDVALRGRHAAGEPDATEELARRCRFRPSALRTAAADLITRPQLSIADYVPPPAH